MNPAHGPNYFPERLAQACRVLGVRLWQDVDQTYLAELVGVSKATVSRWFAGQPPGRAMRQRLAAVLGVSDQYLEYGGDDLGEPPADWNSGDPGDQDGGGGNTATPKPRLGPTAYLHDAPDVDRRQQAKKRKGKDTS